MVCCKVLSFFLAFSLARIEKSVGSLSLGVCTLNCDQNELPARQALGIGPPGPAGKRGPIGPPGSSCDCSFRERLEDRIEQLEDVVAKLNSLGHALFAADCVHVTDSGTAIIFPFSESSAGLHVYCNQEIDGGGWIVIQRRMDGSEDFYRGWDDYVNGFGDKQREFWLGLETIHRITNSGPYELRIDLEAFDGVTGFAKYSTFSVSSASDFYRLYVTGYSGNAGNAMVVHNGQQFSTKENDRDLGPTEHCAVKYTGAWWYNYCHHANLNGVYNGTKAKGVIWYQFKDNYRSLKRVEMKIRKRA